ncbi:GldG family protein [Patescibacteria group bacterium]|nr:GldG family protein [Patescibacteria group bacterium]
MSSQLHKNIFDLSLSSVLLVLALLAGVNILAAQKYIYLDLTEEEIYTTSEATKDILKNLNKEVSVKFYISKDLPVDLENVRTRLEDLMNQYQDIAGAKLKIAYEAPENNQEKVMELAQKGIPQMQFNVIAKDKYEVKQGFFGAEITAGEGDTIVREALPVIQSVANIEYDFISAVYSVSRESKENLAFLEGHGEKQVAIAGLEKYYNVSVLKIMSVGDKKGFYYEKAAATEEEKPEQVFVNPKTLIIAGPSAEITKEEIAMINDYVKNGGNLVVLTEMVNVDKQNNLNAAPVKNNINELVKNYGVTINEDLIYDRYNSSITYSQGFFTVSKPYPFFVSAQKENFGDSASLSGLQAIIFPWVSSLTLADSADYAARSLVASSNQSDSVSGAFNLLPDAALPAPKGVKKTIVAFSQPKAEDSKSGLVYVIGGSEFVSSNFIGSAPDNKTFFINLIDSVSNSVNLSSIRAKSIVDRPIKDLDETEKNYWKFISIFGAALLLDICGFFRIMKRKKANK